MKATPKTLTEAEVQKLLDVTGRAERDMRDHVLLRLTVSTGLRVSEVVALNVGDVRNGKGVLSTVPLRPETTKGHKPRDIDLPERVRRALNAFLKWKAAREEPLDDNAPLFVSRGGGGATHKKYAARGGRRSSGGRLSARTAERLFVVWQKRAGFDRPLHFHCMRHTYASTTLRKGGNLRLVQDVLGHSSPVTTAVYTHVSAEERKQAAERLPW